MGSRYYEQYSRIGTLCTVKCSFNVNGVLFVKIYRWFASRKIATCFSTANVVKLDGGKRVRIGNLSQFQKPTSFEN